MDLTYLVLRNVFRSRPQRLILLFAVRKLYRTHNPIRFLYAIRMAILLHRVKYSIFRNIAVYLL